jgi:hypothetical protein
MIPDRSFLLLALLGMIALAMQMPMAVREAVGLVYGVHALRSHRRAIRSRLR